MMHMAEQQQQQQQHYAAYQQNADSAAQECMAHLSPVPAYFPGFPVFHPQTSEEKEEGEREEQETGQVQVQVQQQSVASKSVTGVSTASSQPSEAGLQLLAELAVARNQQEKLEDAARFGNTTVNNWQQNLPSATQKQSHRKDLFGDLENESLLQPVLT